MGEPMRLEGDGVGKVTEPPRAATYRTGSARPLAAVLWLFAAGTVTWLLAAGDGKAAGGAAPWLLLLSWFAYAALWRPCLRVGGDGFEVINGLRDHRIPFGAIEDIEVQYTTAIRAAGKKYVSWGAPSPPSAFGAGFQHLSHLKSQPHSALPGNERISQTEVKTGRDGIVAAWLQARSGRAADSGATVTSTWNMPMIAAGAVAILAVVIAARLWATG